MGRFLKPNSVSATNFYKCVADAYKQCIKIALQVLHHISSLDCQLDQGVYAMGVAECTHMTKLAEATTKEALSKEESGASQALPPRS